jgi:hypothetical protein
MSIHSLMSGWLRAILSTYLVNYHIISRNASRRWTRNSGSLKPIYTRVHCLGSLSTTGNSSFWNEISISEALSSLYVCVDTLPGLMAPLCFACAFMYGSLSTKRYRKARSATLQAHSTYANCHFQHDSLLKLMIRAWQLCTVVCSEKQEWQRYDYRCR